MYGIDLPLKLSQAAIEIDNLIRKSPIKLSAVKEFRDYLESLLENKRYAYEFGLDLATIVNKNSSKKLKHIDEIPLEIKLLAMTLDGIKTLQKQELGDLRDFFVCATDHFLYKNFYYKGSYLKRVA